MTVVCITGAHRSGTSMITRLLNLSGLYLGMDSDFDIHRIDNPEGFWENLQFVKLNEEILSAHGGAWDMPPSLSANWELSPEMIPFRDRAKQIIRQFENHALWGWKDPRNSLTIDFWKNLLPEMKVLICLRSPLDVVRSLSKRGYSSPEFGFRLWFVYNRHLLNVIPSENLIITHFDVYFNRPRAELERVLALLGISATETQIAAAVDSIASSLRHNQSPWQDILNYRPPRDLIGLYREMCLRAGPHYLDFMQSVHKTEMLDLLNFAPPQNVQQHVIQELALDETRQSQKAATELAHKNNQIEALHLVIRQKEQDLLIAASALENIHNDISWRLLSGYHTLLTSLAPSGSLRRRILDLPVTIYELFQKTPPVTVDPVLPIQPAGVDERLLDHSDSIAVCTIASKNYLSLVRIFACSVASSNPGVPIFVLLVDRLDGYIDPETEPYQLVTLEELDNIPNLQHFCFKYTPIELNTAVKPYFLEYLLEKYHFQKICYFDPDIYVFSKLAGLWHLLEFSSLVLTPHITIPYQDDHHPTEMDINLAGVFNLGFLGISNTATTRKFLTWWQQRLYDYCYMRPSEGMHVDQNWVNFAPAMHDAVFILRDNAYNIAYWNLHERGTRLRFEHANLFIDDRPVVFLNLSGFNPESPETISAHQSRFLLSDLPNVRPVYEFYCALLQKFEYGRIKKWPYAYGKFDNGVPIANIMRGLYNKQSPKQTSKFANPFLIAEEDSFFSWMNEPVDGLDASHERPTVTRLQMEMYNLRADLQRAFPDPLGQDRIRFYKWLLQNGARDLGVDDIFFEDIAPGRRRWIDTLLFKARHFYLKGYHVLKVKIRRMLPNNWLFQKLIYLNKKYLEKVIDPRPVVASPFNTLPERKTSLPFGVNVAGYFQGEFGVGEIARASFKSLTASGVSCVLNNVESYVHRHEDKTLENFSPDNPYRFNLVHVNADQAHVFANLKGPAYFKQRHNIACWFWELSTFPRSWQSSFNYYQEIWVASGFCQESIAAQAPIPVVKMIQPVLIDTAKVKPDRSRLGLPQDKFIYGFVFDYMSVVERKNPLAIINAFKLAFGDREDVLLLIKTINGNQVPNQVQRLHQAARGSNIQFIDGYLARDEVINLVSSLDSYVSLHRSEGLGISMAQAMYLKKPVIATGYSGNMEFMNHNNSFLVRYQLAELQENLGPYTKGQHWAEPDVEHAAELMRLVFDNQASAQKIAERAAADIKANMTPEVTGSAMKERLLLLL
jgi:glycosyltransferase involved in cell wall biosynthesis